MLFHLPTVCEFLLFMSPRSCQCGIHISTLSGILWIMQRSPSYLSRPFKWAFTSGSDQAHGVAELRWAQAVWLWVLPGSYTAEQGMRMKSPVQRFWSPVWQSTFWGSTGSDQVRLWQQWYGELMTKWGSSNIKRLLHQSVVITRTGEIWNIW